MKHVYIALFIIVFSLQIAAAQTSYDVELRDDLHPGTDFHHPGEFYNFLDIKTNPSGAASWRYFDDVAWMDGYWVVSGDCEFTRAQQARLTLGMVDYIYSMKTGIILMNMISARDSMVVCNENKGIAVMIIGAVLEEGFSLSVTEKLLLI